MISSSTTELLAQQQANASNISRDALEPRVIVAASTNRAVLQLLWKSVLMPLVMYDKGKASFSLKKGINQGLYEMVCQVYEMTIINGK